MPNPDTAVRDPGFADFSTSPPEEIGGRRHWLMRAQNFWLEWVESPVAGSSFGAASEHELLVIVAAGQVRIASTAGAEARTVAAHAVAILPRGSYTFIGDTGSTCIVIASQRGDVARRRVLNAAAYDPPDARIVPTGQPHARKRPLDGIEVLDIDAIMASKDKPRLKMLQTETMSFNIVEYEGPRNRAELSPHSHANFEQGSLAIAGNFVHHLRAPWGSDANQWRDDEHMTAPSPSLLVIPVEMIHTTEGVGPGHHFLVDIFSPPRADFIAKGWVFNAGDYEAPAAAR